MASPFPSVCAAVKLILDAIPGAPTTIIHKRDVILARERTANPTLCVISFGDEGGEEWSTTGNGTTDLGTIGKTYSVWIAIYRPNANADLDSSTTNPDFIDAAKEALNKGSLAGVTAVWNTDLEAHAEWENRDFEGGDEVSRFKLWFQTAEARNG